jgi:ribulose-5-phosphate 4-epimerase/fuculose-1-phosphate aldolase
MSAIATVRRSKPVRDQVSTEEWETRVTLAACYRLLARYGMTDLIYNHITARVPGSHEYILINAYGLLYEEVTASNLYKIDLDANVILKPDVDCDINYAGYVIHSAVHSARADATCVIHTHTRATMAVSAMKCGVLPITQTALRFYHSLSYHDYEGPAVDVDERQRLIADLGGSDVMVLRNHGSLVVGRTIPEAFNIAYYLEMACRAQVDALAGGGELIYPPQEARDAVVKSVQPSPNNPLGSSDGSRDWPALLRMLNRIDPSYAS